MVSSHSRTPLGVGTSHEHFGPQDSPRPGLRGSHHLPPYSIFCNASLRLQPKGSFSRDSQVGVSKLSRNCPGWSPGTLNAHNSRLPMDQGTLQRNNFGREDERRVRPGLLSHTISQTGLPLAPYLFIRATNVLGHMLTDPKNKVVGLSLPRGGLIRD